MNKIIGNEMVISELLNNEQVVPVVVIGDQAQAYGLAEALIEGGIRVIEVTLRNEYGIKAIEDIAKKYSEMTVLAGTVCNSADMLDVMEAGASGVVTPGLTDSLLTIASQNNVPILPGVTSPSEVIQAMEYGLTECKLFPANVVGGVSMLKALSGPFPNISFCPTGGVSQSNYQDYLALSNVMCVGGSWLATSKMIESHQWEQITQLCQSTKNDREQ